MAKKVFIGYITDKIEDSGQARIGELENQLDISEEGMFVRLHSYHHKCEHTDYLKFLGKKVMVTVETLS